MTHRKSTFNLDIEDSLIVSPLLCDKLEHFFPQSFKVFKGRRVADIEGKCFRHLFVEKKISWAGLSRLNNNYLRTTANILNELEINESVWSHETL